MTTQEHGKGKHKSTSDSFFVANYLDKLLRIEKSHATGFLAAIAVPRQRNASAIRCFLTSLPAEPGDWISSPLALANAELVGSTATEPETLINSLDSRELREVSDSFTGVRVSVTVI